MSCRLPQNKYYNTTNIFLIKFLLIDCVENLKKKNYTQAKGSI